MSRQNDAHARDRAAQQERDQAAKKVRDDAEKQWHSTDRDYGKSGKSQNG